MPTVVNSCEPLLARFKPGMEVFVAGCAGESQVFIDALRANPEAARGVRFTGVQIPGVNRFSYAGLTPSTRQRCFFLSPELQPSFKQGLVDFMPITYTSIFAWLERQRFDWVIFQGHAHGDGYSLSIAHDFTPAALRHAKHVAVLQNDALPLITKKSVEADQVDLCINAPAPVLSYDAGTLGSVYGVLGEVIANEIPNGATLQFGLGKLQKALIQSLKHHRELRVHSGMVSDPLIDLAQAGALAHPSRSSPPVCTGVALGSHQLYELIGEPALARFMPVSYTHAGNTLASLSQFVSINSIIEIDLTGQVNAECLDGRQISGGGGMADFVLGAKLAWGGKSILATPASADHGRISRIVPKLTNAVTIPRHEVDRVATEFGVVELRGKSIDERAQALISIADPNFRDSLANAWDLECRSR
jgi:acyl-CoA hydrolase